MSGLEGTCPGPDPGLHTRAELLSALGGRFCVWGTLGPRREQPVCRSKPCCESCSSSSQVFQLPHHKGRVFFSCLPGHGVNRPTLVASWEEKLGAAWLEACPALITCPGICAGRATAGGCPPPLPPAWALPSGPRPAGPRVGSTAALACGICPSSLPHLFSCSSLVIDARLWLESFSPGEEMNGKGERDTLIKGTA